MKASFSAQVTNHTVAASLAALGATCKREIKNVSFGQENKVNGLRSPQGFRKSETESWENTGETAYFLTVH
jgi:hypothetical protein